MVEMHRLASIERARCNHNCQLSMTARLLQVDKCQPPIVNRAHLAKISFTLELDRQVNLWVKKKIQDRLVGLN